MSCSKAADTRKAANNFSKDIHQIQGRRNKMSTVYDFTAKDRMGNDVSLSEYSGKVLLIVNTATGCGFTPHYEPLEAMYKEFRDQGFEILDFPCNQFADQAPGSDDEIHEFCTVKFGTEFPQFSKIDVNGETAHPLFAWLASEKPFNGFGKGLKNAALNKFAAANNKKYGDKTYIGWNFTKFLVDREGNVVARFEPTEDMAEVKKAVAAAL
jgi:glutathione peroxidase